jgi:hypothetical protein
MGIKMKIDKNKLTEPKLENGKEKKDYEKKV